MSKGKPVRKCKRGQKLCRNAACQLPMPIHSAVCKTCGYLNSKRKQTDKEDSNIIETFKDVSTKADFVNKKNVNKLKNYLQKRIYEVSIVFFVIVSAWRWFRVSCQNFLITNIFIG